MAVRNSFAKIVLLRKNDKCLYDNCKKFAEMYEPALLVHKSVGENEIIESIVPVASVVVVLNVISLPFSLALGD